MAFFLGGGWESGVYVCVYKDDGCVVNAWRLFYDFQIYCKA